MPKMNELPECYFCHQLMLLPLRTRLIKTGEVVDCCDQCYKTAKEIVKKKEVDNENYEVAEVFVKGEYKYDEFNRPIKEIK